LAAISSIQTVENELVRQGGNKMKNAIIFVSVLAIAIIAVACGRSSTNVNIGNQSIANRTNVPPTDHSSMDHSKMGHSIESSPNASSAPFDLQFLDTMVAHHQGAVEMAEPAAQRAGHEEIKKLAASIISDQKREIAEMKNLREKWFAGAAPAINMEMSGMAGSMKGMDMNLLNSLSGNDFDLEFIKQMVPHHAGAIVMAKEALQKSEKAEIDQMREWQESWSK
jgi:uncharacterized protein (DUF305 family)